MPISSIPTQYVNHCLLVCIKDGSIRVTPSVSHHAKINRVFFENMVLSHFQRLQPGCRTESNVTTGRQKKIECFSRNGVCNHCNTVFEAMGCFYHCFLCEEARLSLSDANTESGVKTGTKTRCVMITNDRKDTKSLRCRSVISGVSIKLMHQSKVISEKTFATNVF